MRFGKSTWANSDNEAFMIMIHYKIKRETNSIFCCNYYCLHSFFLGDRVSLYILGWPGACVEQDGLELWT